MANPAFVPDLTGVDTFLTPTTASISNSSAVSPLAATMTLPSAGIWLVAVNYQLQGSSDHEVAGVWLVHYNTAGSNRMLTSTLLGVVGFSSGSSFGLSTSSLTLSNPSTSGVVTATASWANGGSHTAAGLFSARKLVTV